MEYKVSFITMNTFDTSRINNQLIKIEKIKYPVPFTVVNPIKESKDSKIIIFMNGLNGDRAWLKFFNHDVFDDNFLLSFDQKGQSQNKEKPSQIFRKLVKYNLKIIEYISSKSILKNRDIILIGESWGAIATILMIKKMPEFFKGALAWNIPGKIPPRNIQSNKKELLVLSFKTTFTLLTGINTKSKISFDERLTSNKLLIRASRNSDKKYDNNKTSIAIYFSMFPAWKILVKNNFKIPFIYVQSLEDVMLYEKKWKKIKNYKNVVSFKKGHHILFLENNSLLLGDEIKKLVDSLK